MAAAAKARSSTAGSFDFRGVARRLRESTMLTRTPVAGYASFGALTALEIGAVSGLRARIRNAAESAVFTVDEARTRLRDLVSGSFRPKSMKDLDRHLDARKLKVEMRAYGAGSAATYIVDQVTKGAVPAVQVHRSLSATALERRFGADVAPRGMRPSERPTPPDPNVVRVRRLLHGILPTAKDAPAFLNWEQLQMSLPVLTDGLAYTVQGGKAYIGRPFATASADPAENLRILQDARRQGLRLILPASDRDDAVAGRLVPGMAVLLAADSVLARKVDPRLDHDFMANAFGEGFEENLVTIRSSAQEREMFSSPASNVVDIAQFRADEFKSRFTRRPDPAPAASPVPSKLSVRTTQTMDGMEVVSAWDGARGVDLGPASAMAPGTYLKECAFEIPRGYVRVDEEGSVHHFSMDMRPHNPNGPAVVHPPGSERPPEWALDGVMISEDEFLDRTRDDTFAPGPDPIEPERDAMRSRAVG